MTSEPRERSDEAAEPAGPTGPTGPTGPEDLPERDAAPADAELDPHARAEAAADGPPRPRLFAGLPGLDASRVGFESAVRASLAQALPLFVLYGMGRIDLGIYAAFGAFTAIYGRGEPYASRWLSVSAAGVGVVLSVAAGVAVSLAGTPFWLLLLGLALVIGVTLPASYVLQLIPRGSIFFVFAYLAVAHYPVTPARVGEAMGTAVAVAALSLVIAMSGWVLRRIPGLRDRMRALPNLPERRLRAAIEPEVRDLTIIAVLGSAAAGLIAAALDVASHHYWAMVTVAAIFSAPSNLLSFERTSHRVVGTLAGVGLAAAIFGGGPPTLFVIVACMVCAFLVEAVIGMHYGVALTFVTPLAIGATNLSLSSDWETLFVDRSRETILGGLVASAIILVLRLRLLRRGELLPSA